MQTSSILHKAARAPGSLQVASVSGDAEIHQGVLDSFLDVWARYLTVLDVGCKLRPVDRRTVHQWGDKFPRRSSFLQGMRVSIDGPWSIRLASCVRVHRPGRWLGDCQDVSNDRLRLQDETTMIRLGVGGRRERSIDCACGQRAGKPHKGR